MPSWTMPGPTVRATLLAEARATLPRDFASEDRPAEDMHAQAAIFELAEAGLAHWNRNIHLATASGPWADQHARDRDEARQAGESDEALVARLQTPPDAVTYAALQEAADQILTSAGVSGSALLVRVPRDAGAFAGTTPGTIQSFIGLGDRTWRTGQVLLVALLPVDTPDGVAASVHRALEAKATASTVVTVEIRIA